MISSLVSNLSNPQVSGKEVKIFNHKTELMENDFSCHQSYNIVLFSWHSTFFAAKLQNSPLQVMLLVVKFIHYRFKRKKKKKRDKKWEQVLLTPTAITSRGISYFWCIHLCGLRWLVSLKDVTFAAYWCYILASTISITAARHKCSLSSEDISFPKAVLCQDESSVLLPELRQINSADVHRIMQKLN